MSAVMEIADESLTELAARIYDEDPDVKRVLRLAWVQDGVALYLIETVYTTFPKFVVGLTASDAKSWQILSNCGLLSTAETTFETARQKHWKLAAPAESAEPLSP